MFKTAVIMFTPPRFDEVWYGRCDAAIRCVRTSSEACALILAGDANGGSDLEAFARRACRAGIDPYEIIKAFNGTDPSLKNTRGDARASAHAIAGLGTIERVTVVTCWYHMPRALVALQLELGELDLVVDELHAVPVKETNIEVTYDVIVNEFLGCRDYLAGRPQKSRGNLIGKPDLAASRP